MPDKDHGGGRAEEVRHSAERLEHAAGAVKSSTLKQEDGADRRTRLAADRTILAAERTYAAWVRTGLAALASGIGARALLKDVIPAWLGATTGSLLIVFSGFCFAAAVWRELWPGTEAPEPDVRRLPAPLLIAVNGFLALVSLAALIGVWLAGS